jgi:hypothetical protein
VDVVLGDSGDVEEDRLHARLKLALCEAVRIQQMPKPPNKYDS